MEEKKLTEGLQAIADFIKMAGEDEALSTKIDAIAQRGELEVAPELIKLGEAYGFHFNETDIGHYIDQTRELMPEEMELVSGGCEDNSTASGMGKLFGSWFKTRCFTAGCLISTPTGDKSIREIRVGDEVCSLDADGKKRIAIVTDVMATHEMPIVRVLFENGREWLTTDTQWFYCGGDDYACVKEPGAKKAITLTGDSTGVTSVEMTGKTETVYDFVVNGINVFFVNGIAAEGFSLS